MSQSLSQYTASLISNQKPLSAIDFIESEIGFRTPLWPSQKFVIKLLEGEILDNTDRAIEVKDKYGEKVLYRLTEKGFYDFLRAEGRISLDYQDYLENVFTQLLLALGRRSTKTTTISLWIGAKLYHLLNITHPQEFFNILRDDTIAVTMVALGEDNAAKLFKKLSNFLQASKFFANHLLAEPTTKELNLWTNYDLEKLKVSNNKPSKKNASLSVSAHSNSPSVRGESNVFAVMEEIAHFNYGQTVKRDEPLDKVIYDSLTPSVINFNYPDGRPFGKNFLISSPGGQSGLFYEEHNKAFDLGADSGCLAMRAPTWYFNPTVSPVYFRTQRAKDETTYEKEYGAEFTVNKGAWIGNLSKFYRVFDKSLSEVPASYKKKYFLGLDFGLESDGVAVALAHYEPKYLEYKENLVEKAVTFDDKIDEQFDGRDYIEKEGVYVVDYLKYYRPGEGDLEHELVVDVFDVLDDIDELFLDYPIVAGIHDQWSAEMIAQNIKQRKMEVDRIHKVNFNSEGNSNVAKVFMKLMLEGNIKMLWNQKLEDEFLNLVRVNVGKFFRIEARAGGHDDRYDAISRAVFLTYAYVRKLEEFNGLDLKAIFHRGVSKIVGNGQRLARQKKVQLGPPGIAKRSLDVVSPAYQMRQMRRAMRHQRVR